MPAIYVINRIIYSDMWLLNIYIYILIEYLMEVIKALCMIKSFYTDKKTPLCNLAH